MVMIGSGLYRMTNYGIDSSDTNTPDGIINDINLIGLTIKHINYPTLYEKT